MPKFRKKPVVIDAWRWNGHNPFEPPIPDWNEPGKGIAYEHTQGIVKISTPEGIMTANVGDWIIRGVHGELYSCKPNIFAATYEAV